MDKESKIILVFVICAFMFVAGRFLIHYIFFYSDDEIAVNVAYTLAKDYYYANNKANNYQFKDRIPSFSCERYYNSVNNIIERDSDGRMLIVFDAEEDGMDAHYFVIIQYVKSETHEASYFTNRAVFYGINGSEIDRYTRKNIEQFYKENNFNGKYRY